MYDFGLTSEQFWGLTPAQFTALSDRHDERVKHEERGHAIVAWVIANLFRSKDSPKISVETFMPHGERPQEIDFSQMTPEQVIQRLELAFPRGGNG